MHHRLSIPILALLALALLALVACNTLSPDQQGAIGAVLADMHARGQLTADQYQALLQSLQTGRMDVILEVATEVGAAVVLSLLGVRAWRGPITARRGVAARLAIGQQGAPVTTGAAHGT